MKHDPIYEARSSHLGGPSTAWYCSCSASNPGGPPVPGGVAPDRVLAELAHLRHLLDVVTDTFTPTEKASGDEQRHYLVLNRENREHTGVAGGSAWRWRCTCGTSATEQTHHRDEALAEWIAHVTQAAHGVTTQTVTHADPEPTPPWLTILGDWLTAPTEQPLAFGDQLRYVPDRLEHLLDAARRGRTAGDPRAVTKLEEHLATANRVADQRDARIATLETENADLRRRLKAVDGDYARLRNAVADLGNKGAWHTIADIWNDLASAADFDPASDPRVQLAEEKPDEDRECWCAGTEWSLRRCPVHGEDAPEEPTPPREATLRFIGVAASGPATADAAWETTLHTDLAQGDVVWVYGHERTITKLVSSAVDDVPHTRIHVAFVAGRGSLLLKGDDRILRRRVDSPPQGEDTVLINGNARLGDKQPPTYVNNLHAVATPIRDLQPGMATRYDGELWRVDNVEQYGDEGRMRIWLESIDAYGFPSGERRSIAHDDDQHGVYRLPEWSWRRTPVADVNLGDRVWWNDEITRVRDRLAPADGTYVDHTVVRPNGNEQRIRSNLDATLLVGTRRFRS